ncbi:MAG: FAD-dependent oxidoreductase [Deltaproteobacteria bacterium]|nr:FAD-dependent oxidoreductase [Deltaproteobacteria bacterium]
MKKAVVVGHGAAGWSGAWRLASLGWQTEICSDGTEVGGLLRPHTVAGRPCDRGAHRLHAAALRVPAVARLARHVPLERRQRQGRVLVAGRAFAYPLRPIDLARGLGLRGGAAMVAGLATARLTGGDWERQRIATEDADEGFAAFVRGRAGEAAYQAFYRPYAEKVWGLDPAELSQTCAKQRVSSTSPWQLLWGRDRDAFLYPRGGFGAWMTALVAAARQAGVRSGPVGRVHRANLGELDADAVLFTGHLADLLTPEQQTAAGLEHRGLALVWLAVPDEQPGPVDTWYTPDASWWFGRVSEVGRFLHADGGRGRLLCVEIPQGRHPPGRSFLSELATLRAQLDDAGILAARAVISEAAEHFEPAVYPLYRRGWQGRWRQALRLAGQGGRVFPAGRQGLWLHCNVDHAMATADAAADAIAGHGDSARWAGTALAFDRVRVRD